jgi:predicted MFS family arabinose efflux permease
LFLTNNVTFIAINGLVGLSLAPFGWMATLPVMGYVIGGALSTPLVARTQHHFGRKTSFQMGLAVAFASAILCAYAAVTRDFWLLCAATVVAGYYNANANLYRFAAAELASKEWREKAVSLVMAGGLIGAVAGPNLAAHTRTLTAVPFTGAYLALAVVAVLSYLAMLPIAFEPHVATKAHAGGRPLSVLMRQPVFIVAATAGALSFGVMNLLMAATPIAMQQCGLPFSDAAFVLEWHVIGMFAPGFFTGHLIKRFGALTIMALGTLLYALCISVACRAWNCSNSGWPCFCWAWAGTSCLPAAPRCRCKPTRPTKKTGLKGRSTSLCSPPWRSVHWPRGYWSPPPVGPGSTTARSRRSR